MSASTTGSMAFASQYRFQSDVVGSPRIPSFTFGKLPCAMLPSKLLRVRERTTSAGLREPPQRWWPPVAQRSPTSAEPTVCAVPLLFPARTHNTHTVVIAKKRGALIACTPIGVPRPRPEDSRRAGQVCPSAPAAARPPRPRPVRNIATVRGMRIHRR